MRNFTKAIRTSELQRITSTTSSISFHFKNKVHKIIKELFEAATMEAPPKGIAHCKMVSCKNRYKNLIINPYFKINAIESSVG